MDFFTLIKELLKGEANINKAGKAMKIMAWVCVLGGLWNAFFEYWVPFNETPFNLPPNYPDLALTCGIALGILFLMSSKTILNKQPMGRRLGQVSIILTFFILTFAAIPASAWNIHPLLLQPMVAGMPEVRTANQAPVHSLQTFLIKNEKGLEKVLAQEEEWSRTNLEWYSSRPNDLTFTATGNPDDVRQRFFHAIRINPNSKTALYLQLLPGADTKGRPQVSVTKITFLSNTAYLDYTVFVSLKEGEMVTPLEVVVTASDEPDTGIDVGLYEDNNTEAGRQYGFGRQPFGNPNLEYGSQAPIHMGFYHESAIIAAAAGVLKQTYPEHRIHLFKTLSMYAFSIGEDYWGWRFMGWGLHYLTDLGQPYHATLLPGISTIKTLWINGKYMAGFADDYNNAVQLVSNRHSVFEWFQMILLQKGYQEGRINHSILEDLQAPVRIPDYQDTLPRDVVAKSSNAKSGKLDKALERWMPEQLVSDPGFEFGDYQDRWKLLEIIRKHKGEEGVKQLTLILNEILSSITPAARSYVKGIIKQ